jgi:hypothetical protein
MPINVKSIQSAEQSMTEAAGTISARYTRGIANADWVDPAKSDAAESLYGTKVQQAATNKTRQKAIAKLTNAAWLTPAQGKGAQRIAAGFTAGITKWGTNWAPYGQALAALNLPPRQADGMANLQNRAGAVVQAMITTKQQIQSGA